MGTKFDKDSLAVEKNNYASKILNAYIVIDLDAGPRNSTNYFKFKNYLFGSTNIMRNYGKESLLNSSYGMTFDGAASWNFGYNFARNVVNFGVDKSSSSHSDNRNRKNNFFSAR